MKLLIKLFDGFFGCFIFNILVSYFFLLRFLSNDRFFRKYIFINYPSGTNRLVFLLTPTHGRLVKTDIHQPCTDIGCCLESLPGAMNDKDGWWERERERERETERKRNRKRERKRERKRGGGTPYCQCDLITHTHTHTHIYIYIYIYMCVGVCLFLKIQIS